MNTFIKCCLFLIMLSFTGACAHAQDIHFSELQSIYHADSASFRNFGRAHGFDKEFFREYPQDYYISLRPPDGKKIDLARSFGKDPGDSVRTTYVLNYFFGFDKQQMSRLEKEIKAAGFRFKERQSTNHDQIFTIDKDMYADDQFDVYLETHRKNGQILGYGLALARQLKKPG
jgi:hypothetical protein